MNINYIVFHKMHNLNNMLLLTYNLCKIFILILIDRVASRIALYTVLFRNIVNNAIVTHNRNWQFYICTVVTGDQYQPLNLYPEV